VTSSVRRTLAITLALIVISVPAFAQRGRRGGGNDTPRRPAAPPVWKGKADLSGKVTDEAGKGIGDAKVTLVLTALNSGLFVMTKKNGEFSAKDMKAGQWHMVVEAPGFAVWQKDVEVTDAKNPAVNVKLARDNSPELIAKAEELFKAGKMAEARAEYLKVRELHLELAAVNRAIAFTYGRERNHAEALKYLDMALAESPTDPLMLQLAAGSAMELNDVPRALDYLSKIDDQTLTDPDPLLNIAVGLLRKQQFAEALKVTDRAIARFPQAADGYFYRGLGRYQAKDSAGAKADLEKYISMAPADAAQVAQAKDLLSKIK
jgi:tetratricopeptide (TPR) repeat protein